mgnify:CR=1 FL=1
MGNIELGYTITTDPNLLDHQNDITPEMSHMNERYHQMAMEGKKSSIKKIREAIKKHPYNPQLKNFLSVLYAKLEYTQKTFDVNKWIVVEHPNYLFGKLNLANEYYSKQEYDKMLEVLGREMDLKALYPNRDTFHMSEVISFLKCTVLYFIAIGDIEEAEIRYEIMHNLAPDAPETEFVLEKLFIERMLAGQKRYEAEQKKKISVTTKPQEITTITQAPSFTHQEIEWLYCNGLYIGKEKIDTILSLPKDTLIQDPELVLQDSINRYYYFQKLTDDNGWVEEKMNFVIHSLYFLAELKASDSLDTIFNVASQSNEYLELYIGDFLSSSIWEIMYKIGANKLEACKLFMFKPGVDTYARIIFVDMVEQLAFHQPERRGEAIN